MTAPDHDNPEAEEAWCLEQQSQVAEYLHHQGVKHGRIGEWPAWHIAPYVSIWAIESAESPGWVGWWAISGDLPTDYISAEVIKHPRDAMREIAERWLDVALHMKQGAEHPTIRVGTSGGNEELSTLLKSRASQLLKWSKDESVWGPDYE